MKIIEGALRNYAWGSRTALATLTGRPVPSPHPEAELWFGAHSGAPSTVPAEGKTLQEVIASDPQHHLGAAAGADAADAAAVPTLPFLLKLLAAQEALSIQVHPTKVQAEQGFAQENAAGIGLRDFARNYKDDNHKPELLVALTDFEALAGFRPPTQTRRLFTALQNSHLRSLEALLAPGDGVDADIRSILTTLVTLPMPVVRPAIEEIRQRCEEIVAAETEEPWIVAVADLIGRLIAQYGADRGVLCALLLNHVTLAPGEAMFLDAGQLHAYVRGFGVEIMANSDNVLRGGLTTKHVDVPELMRIVQCDPLDNPTILPDVDGFYATPAREFQLQRVTGAVETTVTGPAIVLSVSPGVAVAQAGQPQVDLAPANAVWVAAGEAEVEVKTSSPDALVFIATVPRAGV